MAKLTTKNASTTAQNVTTKNASTTAQNVTTKNASTTAQNVTTKKFGPSPKPQETLAQVPARETTAKSSSSSSSSSKSKTLVTQSFQTVAPPAPPIPKEVPKNLASISHNPGAISSKKRIEAQKNTNPVEDIITARIVGANFQTGEAIVKDGSGNQYNVQVGISALRSSISPSGRSASFPSVVVGQSVIISRARSQQGETSVRLLSVVPLSQSPQDALASFSGSGNVNELCRPSEEGSISQGPRSRPEDPSEPEEPAPPIPPQPNSPDPEENPDPPSKPFGCKPEDSAQWFDGEICPPGTINLGFAILPNGQTKSLCEGSNTPPGDGCPETPDEFGWVCEDGNCINVPFGLYTTESECLAVCSTPEDPPDEIPLTLYSCSGGVCSPDPSGSFGSIEDCDNSRTPIYGPPITGGQCVAGYNFQVRENFSSFPANVRTVIVGAAAPISSVSAVTLGTNLYRVEGVGRFGFFASANISTSSTFTGATVLAALRVDGQPDDCGDIQGPFLGYTC